MSKPTALEALTFFKQKFPEATAYDAGAIVELMHVASSLMGGYMASIEQRAGGWKQAQTKIEHMFGVSARVNASLHQLFGVNRDECPEFDPSELSDSLGYNDECRALFGLSPKD